MRFALPLAVPVILVLAGAASGLAVCACNLDTGGLRHAETAAAPSVDGSTAGGPRVSPDAHEPTATTDGGNEDAKTLPEDAPDGVPPDPQPPDSAPPSSTFPPVDIPVSANNRDAWSDDEDGSVDVCKFGDISWTDAAGFQWPLTIPQGAHVSDAFIEVYALAPGGAGQSYRVKIAVEDVDAASAFEARGNEIQARTYWGTTVSWTIPAGGFPMSTWIKSPPITPLLQHIVDRPTWKSGNHLTIAIWGETDGGGCMQRFNDFSENPSRAAKLHVE